MRDKNRIVKIINAIIRRLKKHKLIEENEISDGHHTFTELYNYRKLYNALLFNEWARDNKIEVYKSKKHYDGEECFGGEWFVVIAILPTGQISNHYKLKDWDLFQIPEYEKSKYEYDNHNSKDVIDRLNGFLESYK